MVFSSDNGPWLPYKQNGGSAGLLRDGKGSTWEGGMREPTIWWWPGTIEAGRTTQAMGSTLDLMPTMAAWCGYELPDDRVYDGYDLSAVVHGAEVSPRREMFFANVPNRFRPISKLSFSTTRRKGPISSGSACAGCAQPSACSGR